MNLCYCIIQRCDCCMRDIFHQKTWKILLTFWLLITPLLIQKFINFGLMVILVSKCQLINIDLWLILCYSTLLSINIYESNLWLFIWNFYICLCKLSHLFYFVYPASEAVNILYQRGVCQQTNAPVELLASDVQDHYRTYSLLEKLLHTPPKLVSEQLAFQIEPQTSQMLIEMWELFIISCKLRVFLYVRMWNFWDYKFGFRYYEFNDSVVRELLGKKLTSKNRKDLDEISEKTGVSLKGCRRQYDNIKRVFKVVEDTPGPLGANIKQNFLLPDELAK